MFTQAERTKTLSRGERALRSGGFIVYHPTSTSGWQVLGIRLKSGNIQVKVRGDEWWTVESPSQLSIREK
jgi:hypothetical protein